MEIKKVLITGGLGYNFFFLYIYNKVYKENKYEKKNLV
jgi:hypothetical protein